MTHETECSFSGGTAFHSLDYRRVFPPYVTAQGSKDLKLRLSEYYQRQLSFPADIVDAFAGIVNACDLSSEVFNNNYENGALAHFYGVLIHYDIGALDSIRISFLEGLRWDVSFPDFWYRPPPSNIFPSWSWAAIKAARQAHYPGTLYSAIGAAANPMREWRDIDVQIHHCTHGVQPISTLYGNNYKDYLPLVDITTWVQRFALRRLSTGVGYIQLYNQTIDIFDDAASHKGEVHALCTHVGGYPIVSDICGLLIVETDPGLYRRIGILQITVSEGEFQLSRQEARDLHDALTAMGVTEESRRERRARDDEWNSPSTLGKMPQWERRTMRLV
jgi:hypothetical protein